MIEFFCCLEYLPALRDDVGVRRIS